MPRPKSSDPNKQVSALESLRTALIGISLPNSSTIDVLGHVFLERLKDVLEYVVASVYLKTTKGTLDRIITSLDSGNSTISYLDGSNALCILLKSQEPLQNERDIATLNQVLAEYRQIGGDDFILERAPLDGSSQTFGMVELVCRNPEYSGDEFPGLSGPQCLRIASGSLAGAITTFRSRNETMVLAALSRFLSDPEVEDSTENVQAVFERGLRLVVEGLLDYRASVLRVAKPDGSLEVCARAGDSDISWDSWEDRVVRGGEALAGEVLMQKDHVIWVAEIAAHQNRFINLKWTVLNNLKSCISCPLVARGSTLGTITFYTGFVYSFSELDEAIIWSLSARFAAFWERHQVLAEKERAEYELESIRYDHQNRLLESARQAAVRASELQLTGVLHESKGTYTSAILLLAQARDAAPAERIRLIDRCLSILEAGEQRLDGPRLLDFSLFNSIDVNDQIRQLVSQRSRWEKERGVGVSFSLDLEPLPLIGMSEEDLIEVIENLLSNSIRSIRCTSRKKGEIQISSKLVRGTEDRELEIVVQDNGAGIRRDLLERVFDKGFTTNEHRGGSGLGLYLVKSIVALYKGRIRVESQFGSWARFIIRLPVDSPQV